MTRSITIEELKQIATSLSELIHFDYVDIMELPPWDLCFGIYEPTTKTIWIRLQRRDDHCKPLYRKEIIDTLLHELVHTYTLAHKSTFMSMHRDVRRAARKLGIL